VRLDAIQSLIVPKTCSTMLRWTRMALCISSRRRCMASITASRSQRVMRRCLLGVHMAFWCRRRSYWTSIG
jgi:disulfide bond formation protein DsbB